MNCTDSYTSFYNEVMAKNALMQEAGFSSIARKGDDIIGYYPLALDKKAPVKILSAAEKVFEILGDPLLVIFRQPESTTWFYLEGAKVKKIESSELGADEFDGNYKVISSIYTTQNPRVFIMEPVEQASSQTKKASLAGRFLALFQ